MQKRILKKIATEWAAGILLHGTGMDSFDEEEDGLTPDEAGYIVEEVGRIALRITKGETPSSQLIDIVQKYYDFE
jgi:hypothetical protein